MNQENSDKITLKTPLISVNVVTYNSSATIVETLESIKAQTYKRIELIISDDCSKDNTVEVCEKWVAKNKSRFENCRIITTKENTGISKNCNRALYAATGEWIKPIAGDDTLKTDCLQNLLKFALDSEDKYIIYSNVDKYQDILEKPENLIQEPLYHIDAHKFSELDLEHQLKVMARFVIVRAPSLFFHRKKVTDIGGFDEGCRYMEDWPSYYNWIGAGLKFYYLNISTANYRIHSASISNKKESELSNFSRFPLLVEDFIRCKFYQDYNIKEKLLFNLEYGYYKYYVDRRIRNQLSRLKRRIWYYFVLKSLSYRRNALNRFYDKSVK